MLFDFLSFFILPAFIYFFIYLLKQKLLSVLSN